MKVIIAGSRNIELFTDEIAKIILASGFDVTEEVCGGAPGVDDTGFRWAVESGISVRVFRPDWRKHGKAAGPIRNRLMANHADALIAVWDGESRGTANMIEEMRALGKPVYIRRIDQHAPSEGRE